MYLVILKFIVGWIFYFIELAYYNLYSSCDRLEIMLNNRSRINLEDMGIKPNSDLNELSTIVSVDQFSNCIYILNLDTKFSVENIKTKKISTTSRGFVMNS